MKDYQDFENWLDALLTSELPKNIAAFNFNLYEDPDDTYAMQLIASDVYDEDNDEWACNEIYSSEENLFIIEKSEEISDWTKALTHFNDLVLDYLAEGKNADVLKAVKAVGIGFVDGELLILHARD